MDSPEFKKYLKSRQIKFSEYVHLPKEKQKRIYGEYEESYEKGIYNSQSALMGFQSKFIIGLGILVTLSILYFLKNFLM